MKPINSKIFLSTISVALSLAITGCNGGSGSSLTPTPAPTPSPAPLTIGYAYITDSTNYYIQCSVDKSGIESSTCNTIIPTGQGAMHSSYGIAINESYAYFTNLDNNSYTQCSVDESGIESSTCNTVRPSGVGALGSPVGIAINESYAYFTNLESNSYTQCIVSESGIESSTCNTVIPSGNGALYGPYGITFNESYVYITNTIYNINGFSYTQCSVDENGIESSTCNTVIPSGNGALSVPYGVASNESYAYFSFVKIVLDNVVGGYTMCNMNESGIESNTCENTMFNPNMMAQPNGITLTESYAYFINGVVDMGNDNSYIQCKIEANKINSATCKTMFLTHGNHYSTGLAFSWIQN